MGQVLEHLGAGVAWKRDELIIDATTPHVCGGALRAGQSDARVHRRAGAAAGACRTRAVAMPGGDNIGSRPIDLHINGLMKMGARIRSEHGFLEAETPHGLRGASIPLDYPSVGATENLMMAAVAASGTTVIDNAAREPEIADIAHFLIEMGARISGAGSNTLEIEGVHAFAPVTHEVIPDRIETGTWAAAALATRGDVTLAGARPDHLELFLDKLVDAGALVELTEAGLRVWQEGRPRAVDFVTLPYPGLATDFQPILMAALSVAQGTSIATENVFESRFLYVGELRRMGADISTEGHHAVIRGVDRLSAAPVRALDIRAGAAMVIAALCADGVTAVSDMQHVDRGYEEFEEKLTALGAEVRREPELVILP